MRLSAGFLRGSAALAAGLAQGYAFAPANSWLELTALCVLFYLFAQAKSLKEGFLLGFTFGLGWFCLSLSWTSISIHEFGNLPLWFAAFCVFALSAYLALYPAISGWVCAWFNKRSFSRACSLLLTAPTSWALTEWLRGWVLTGFPWNATAYAHVDGFLVKLAPLCGADGINFFAAFFAGGLTLIWLERKSLRKLVLPFVCLFSLAAVCAGLSFKDWSQPGKTVPFRLVQGGLDQDLKFTTEGFLAAYRRYLSLASAPGLQKETIIVLPETIFPIPISRLNSDVRKEFYGVTKNGASLLFGGFLFNRPEIRNAVFLVQAGKEQAHYSKRHLVPFGEVRPYGFRWFIEMLQIPMADLTAGGASQKVFVADGIKLAPLLCYEDLFPEEVRDWWKSGSAPNVLVNLSNLAWFGDSTALPQHLNFSRMRALEFSRPVVRATNTGITAYISADGQVRNALPPMRAALLDVSVQTRTGEATMYAKYGSAPWLWLMLFGLAGTFVSALRKNKC